MAIQDVEYYHGETFELVERCADDHTAWVCKRLSNPDASTVRITFSHTDGSEPLELYPGARIKVGYLFPYDSIAMHSEMVNE